MFIYIYFKKVVKASIFLLKFTNFKGFKRPVWTLQGTYTSCITYVHLRIFIVIIVACLCACFDLSGVGTELRKVSDKVQRIKSSLQLCLSGTTLLPQLPLSQLSVLEEQ